MTESKEMSVLDKVVATIKDTFVPDETPYGKRKHDQVGNNLFQDAVIGPIKLALQYQKKIGKRELTPEQEKRKRKNRAKRKLQRASRKANR